MVAPHAGGCACELGEWEGGPRHKRSPDLAGDDDIVGGNEGCDRHLEVASDISWKNWCSQGMVNVIGGP